MPSEALRSLGDLGAARSYAQRAVAAGSQSHMRGNVHRLATLATILAGQGDADAAVEAAGDMVDKALSMESCRISERLITVRNAIVAVSDGRSAQELSERVDDLTGVPVRV